MEIFADARKDSVCLVIVSKLSVSVSNKQLTNKLQRC